MKICVANKISFIFATEAQKHREQISGNPFNLYHLCSNENLRSKKNQFQTLATEAQNYRKKSAKIRSVRVISVPMKICVANKSVYKHLPQKHREEIRENPFNPCHLCSNENLRSK